MKSIRIGFHRNFVFNIESRPTKNDMSTHMNISDQREKIMSAGQILLCVCVYAIERMNVHK